jgi:hypothetical protein
MRDCVAQCVRFFLEQRSAEIQQVKGTISLLQTVA